MPQMSSRITGLTGGGDDGWHLFSKARAMKDAGLPILELTIGEHDIRTAPDILDAMAASARAGHTGYAAVGGTAALRQAVAERLTRQSGVPHGPENVLITPGGQAALFAAHALACDPGDRALMIDPYYVTYPGTIRGVGAIPCPVPTRPEDGFQPQEADLMAAPDAKSLLINSPNNPTGAVYTKATQQGIARAAMARDLWVIADEVYDTQVWDGSHRPLVSLQGMAERVLTVGSLSKSHAMTGSRIGWVAGPKEAVAQMMNFATHTTYGVPGFIQDAGTFALAQADETAIAAPFKRRRQVVLDRLARQNVIKPVPPAGAMYVMLDVRALGLSGEGFAEHLLDNHHVAVMPGESFGKAAAGHVRVALTLPDPEFAEALERLISCAAELAAQR